MGLGYYCVRYGIASMMRFAFKSIQSMFRAGRFLVNSMLRDEEIDEDEDEEAADLE